MIEGDTIDSVQSSRNDRFRADFDITYPDAREEPDANNTEVSRTDTTDTFSSPTFQHQYFNILSRK